MAPLFRGKPKEQLETPKREAANTVKPIAAAEARPLRTPLKQIEPNSAPSRPVFKSKPYGTPPESEDKRKAFKSRTFGHQLLDTKENRPRCVVFQDRKRASTTDDDSEYGPSSPPPRRKRKGGDRSLAELIQLKSLELRTLRPHMASRIPIEQPEWQYWNKYASISSEAVLLNPQGVYPTHSKTAYALRDNIFVAEFET